MYELISRVRRVFGAARASKKLDAAASDETMEKIFEHLRDAARRQLKRKRQHPKSSWRRVRDEHPNLDKAAYFPMNIPKMTSAAVQTSGGNVSEELRG
jgi:hypothetical protein